MVATAYPEPRTRDTVSTADFPSTNITVYYSDSGATITGEDSQGDSVIVSVNVHRRTVRSFRLPEIDFDVGPVLSYFDFIESLLRLPEYPRPPARPPPDDPHNPSTPIRGPPRGPFLFPVESSS